MTNLNLLLDWSATTDGKEVTARERISRLNKLIAGGFNLKLSEAGITIAELAIEILKTININKRE